MSTITITFDVQYLTRRVQTFTFCLSPVPEGQTPETLMHSPLIRYLCQNYANLYGYPVRRTAVKSITAGGKHTPTSTLTATYDISPAKYQKRKEFTLQLSPVPEQVDGLSLWHSVDLEYFCYDYATLCGVEGIGTARLLTLSVDRKVFALEEEERTRRTTNIPDDLHAWIRDLEGDHAADEAARYAHVLPIGGEYEGTGWRIVRCS